MPAAASDRAPAIRAAVEDLRIKAQVPATGVAVIDRGVRAASISKLLTAHPDQRR